MALHPHRPGFLFICSGVAALICASSVNAAEDVGVRVETLTHKKIGNIEIKADLHRADDEALRPVVVWIHGGALITGHREGMDGRVRRMLLDEGYAVVSFDYRLAPETPLPKIIEDVEDAWQEALAE